ncbi:hypothetical protein B5864_13650 [Salmonella enterica]|uniref:Uncharacterized protein n=2 Tax=Salmonella enterica TaxID=28901 RepID=A0A403T203_SALER|nr:hypothetical protein [Salmonella enterica subsp. enterica serovar Hadar]EAY1188764.1 hypothetical protein [Salmonella enterica]EBQ9003673.1 hypothetical protein [Salmonella enterica subsp. enterica serovar Blockley]EBR8259003.1 hypothetical protein [Salmonella enterica subsp. enterica serovar Cerro]EBW7251945.1 hypothetical protein [Salmonella enterica subsp. enterica serovar Gatow]EBX7469467.1 hypothetical protein [Salmonella enterica subsp. enterica serovar Bareilly]EBZ6268359.1 hypothet
MKLLILFLSIIVISMVSGILIAEFSYIILIFIKYLAYGYIHYECSEALRGLKIGGIGGGILGVGIVLFRLLGIKGF